MDVIEKVSSNEGAAVNLGTGAAGGAVADNAAPAKGAGAGSERPLPPTTREMCLALVKLIERSGGQHDAELSAFVAKVRVCDAFDQREQREREQSKSAT